MPKNLLRSITAPGGAVVSTSSSSAEDLAPSTSPRDALLQHLSTARLDATKAVRQILTAGHAKLPPASQLAECEQAYMALGFLVAVLRRSIR